ncbi:uncharacterized protein DS421_16g549350 [Arachis hypogaea]|nr:uncharacterized protein DS421_16g549350 [Arachis hypogaea]
MRNQSDSSGTPQPTSSLCSFIGGTRQSFTLALTSSLHRLSPLIVTPLTSSLSVSHGHGLLSSLSQSLTLSPHLIIVAVRAPALRSLRRRQKAHRRQKSSSISASAPSGQSSGGGRLLGRGLETN